MQIAKYQMLKSEISWGMFRNVRAKDTDYNVEDEGEREKGYIFTYKEEMNEWVIRNLVYTARLGIPEV